MCSATGYATALSGGGIFRVGGAHVPHRLSRVLVGGFVAVAFTQIASAADLPRKAPAAPPPPAINWTGFYVGGNVGYGWGSVKHSDLSLLQTGNGGAFATLAAPANRIDANGAIGGLQVGYNWQSQNFLLGIEADIQASGQKGTDIFNTVITTNVLAPPFNVNPTTVTYDSKLEYFGTVRGRFGITYDRWLGYFTGGLAYGRVKTDINAQPAPAVAGANAPFIWSNAGLKTGWVVGVGLENALSSNWSWRIEYLYMNLGSVTANLSPANFPLGGNCYGTPGICASFGNQPSGGPITARFTDNIMRVGLNYKFN